MVDGHAGNVEMERGGEEHQKNEEKGEVPDCGVENAHQQEKAFNSDLNKLIFPSFVH